MLRAVCFLLDTMIQSGPGSLWAVVGHFKPKIRVCSKRLLCLKVDPFMSTIYMSTTATHVVASDIRGFFVLHFVQFL